MSTKERQLLWHGPVISALERLRERDHEIKASVSYIARFCLKKIKQKNLCQYTNVTIKL
jgi:hypothetical protein